MVKCKCIEKKRNKHGIIKSYVLQDNTGRKLEITAEQLKQAIFFEQVEVTNLKLTADGKLINKQDINIPDNINKIGNDAFSDKKQLHNEVGGIGHYIELPKNININDRAFIDYKPENIGKNIKIPAGAKIDSSAFIHSKSLGNVYIDEMVTIFKRCIQENTDTKIIKSKDRAKLADLLSKTIGREVKTITMYGTLNAYFIDTFIIDFDTEYLIKFNNENIVEIASICKYYNNKKLLNSKNNEKYIKNIIIDIVKYINNKYNENNDTINNLYSIIKSIIYDSTKQIKLFNYSDLQILPYINTDKGEIRFDINYSDTIKGVRINCNIIRVTLLTKNKDNKYIITYNLCNKVQYSEKVKLITNKEYEMLPRYFDFTHNAYNEVEISNTMKLYMHSCEKTLDDELSRLRAKGVLDYK